MHHLGTAFDSACQSSEYIHTPSVSIPVSAPGLRKHTPSVHRQTSTMSITDLAVIARPWKQSRCHIISKMDELRCGSLKRFLAGILGSNEKGATYTA